MHDNPEPTEREQDEAPQRNPEEPMRDPRQGEPTVPGDTPPEEPIHES